jgi:hypothetical protein
MKLLQDNHRSNASSPRRPGCCFGRNGCRRWWLEGVVAAQARNPGGGLIVMPDAFTTANRELIVTLAAYYSVPAIYNASFFVKSGSARSGPEDPSPAPMASKLIVEPHHAPHQRKIPITDVGSHFNPQSYIRNAEAAFRNNSVTEFLTVRAGPVESASSAHDVQLPAT